MMEGGEGERERRMRGYSHAVAGIAENNVECGGD